MKNRLLIIFCLIAGVMSAQPAGSATIIASVPGAGPGLRVFFDTDTDQSHRGAQFSSFTGQSVFGTVAIYNKTTSIGDTIAVGAYDCNGNYVSGIAVVTVPNDSILVALGINCYPHHCTSVADELRAGAGSYLKLYNLVDSIGGGAQVAHSVSFDGGLTFQGPIFDTIQIPAGASSYCFYQDFCGPLTMVCDSLNSGGGTPGNCRALWTVDSVNSINFAGNVVLWNLSTGGTATNPLNYIWDWGDGTTSSGQYPMHSYSDTGIYNICLTVIDPMTNCTDTFCDSLGFDANGNLVYKGTSFKGFTVVVIDPATIGVEEIASEPMVGAFPNPSSGLIYVKSETHRILDVNVFNMNGQLLQNVSGNKAKSEAVLLELSDAGLYLLQIQTDAGTTTQKVMVE